MTARDLGLLALRVGVGGTLFAPRRPKTPVRLVRRRGPGADGRGDVRTAWIPPGQRKRDRRRSGRSRLAVRSWRPGSGLRGAAAAVAGKMIVASSRHAASGFFNSKGGFEFPAVLGWSAVALALTGPGAVSLDHVLGHRFNRSWMRNIALAAVALGRAPRSSPNGARTVAAQTPAYSPVTPAWLPDPCNPDLCGPTRSRFGGGRASR